MLKRLKQITLSLIVALAFSLPAIAAESPAVSFRNDVMPVLSKAGCAAGACHGNKSGKGGFKLSLRGQDPDADFDVLTRDLFARRTNAMEPAASLILLKATAQIPHEGGLRFKRDSNEYRILHEWIASGLSRDGDSTPKLVKLEVTPSEQVLVEPAADLQIKATAVFSDGSRRDVSNLSVFEQSSDLAKITGEGAVTRQRMGETTVIVRYLQMQQPVRLAFVPARPGFQWQPTASNNYIDEQVLAKLKSLRVNPSGSCTENEYLRRAYLDIAGVLPTPAEAKAYLADAAPDKRARLVNGLLERPEYADYWASKWADLLRIEERTLDRKGVQSFHHWIRQSVAANKPLDQFVRELLSATGSTYTNPPANFYRANREPVVRGEATAQLFLGVRLQCAQCHNHPFDRWTQDDYFGWADVFSRVNYKVLENRRTDDNDKHEFVGEQIVFESSTGEIKDPRGDRGVKPRLLGMANPVADDVDRLSAVAEWVTSPKNPYFARAQVNRIWFHLMGRGLVDPIDDFRPTNPASHPKLLDQLAKDFVAHGYDVRYMIRLITASQTYAMSSTPNATNADDEANYSHVIERRLTAEQLLDAQHEFAGVPAEFGSYPKGMRAAQVPGVRPKGRDSGPTAADQFLVTFGKPPRTLVCECERSSDTTLGQTFELMNGPETASLLAAPMNRIGKLMSQNRTDAEIIGDLYWAALTRPPSNDERGVMVDHVHGSPNRRQGLEDVAWALLNAKEFVLRR